MFGSIFAAISRWWATRSLRWQIDARRHELARIQSWKWALLDGLRLAEEPRCRRCGGRRWEVAFGAICENHPLASEYLVLPTSCEPCRSATVTLRQKLNNTVEIARLAARRYVLLVELKQLRRKLRRHT